MGNLTKYPPDFSKNYDFSLHDLNQVHCFGSEQAPKDKLDRFQWSYEDVGHRITPKIHCLNVHVMKFCLQTGKGVGPVSEQLLESLLSDFVKTRKRSAMPVWHPKYGENLLKSVICCNSFHIWPKKPQFLQKIRSDVIGIMFSLPTFISFKMQNTKKEVNPSFDIELMLIVILRALTWSIPDFTMHHSGFLRPSTLQKIPVPKHGNFF